MSEYEEMNKDEQIALLDEFARDVLVQCGLSARSLECVHHSFNTTFKLTTPDAKTFALRISTDSRKWPEHIWAETQWLLELAREGSIFAPVPILNLQSEPFSNHYFFYQGGNLDVVIYPWIEGKIVEKNPTDEQLFQVGRAMATMHKLGKNWKPEGYANFMPVDKPLMVKRDNLFTFAKEHIDPELFKVFEEVNLRATKLFDALRERAEPQLIHADLQFANVLWHNDAMSILDFDDAGIGFPLQDLAISIFYLREGREAEKHLLAGYTSTAPLPEYEQSELELLIASRSLALLNLLFETTKADDLGLIPEYVEKTGRRLKYYLDTGEFVLLP